MTTSPHELAGLISSPSPHPPHSRHSPRNRDRKLGEPKNTSKEGMRGEPPLPSIHTLSLERLAAASASSERLPPINRPGTTPPSLPQTPTTATTVTAPHHGHGSEVGPGTVMCVCRVMVPTLVSDLVHKCPVHTRGEWNPSVSPHSFHPPLPPNSYPPPARRFGVGNSPVSAHPMDPMAPSPHIPSTPDTRDTRHGDDYFNAQSASHARFASGPSFSDSRPRSQSGQASRLTEAQKHHPISQHAQQPHHPMSFTPRTSPCPPYPPSPSLRQWATFVEHHERVPSTSVSTTPSERAPRPPPLRITRSAASLPMKKTREKGNPRVRSPSVTVRGHATSSRIASASQYGHTSIDSHGHARPPLTATIPASAGTFHAAALTSTSASSPLRTKPYARPERAQARRVGSEPSLQRPPVFTSDSFGSTSSFSAQSQASQTSQASQAPQSPASSSSSFPHSPHRTTLAPLTACQSPKGIHPALPSPSSVTPALTNLLNP